jgi:hypothetical protein
MARLRRPDPPPADEGMPERLARFVQAEWVTDDTPAPTWWTPTQGTPEAWRYLHARLAYDRARRAWKAEHGVVPPTNWDEEAS